MKLRAMAALLAVCSLLHKPDLSVPIQRTSSTGRPLDFPHARQTSKECDLPGTNSGCLARLLNRLEEFQQVGVDFILVSSREAVGPARIIDFL